MNQSNLINVKPCKNNIGVFRIMSRQVVENVLMLEKTRMLIALTHWVGFKSGYIYTKRPNRLYGKSKYNFLSIY